MTDTAKPTRAIFDAERLDEIERIARAATQGPWVWWTNDSWKRLRQGLDAPGSQECNVLVPYVCRDGHPDCTIKQDDMQHIATMSPSTTLELTSALRAAQDEVERLRKAVRTSAMWFQEYAGLHKLKGTPDAEAKAERNQKRADWLRDALGQEAK